MAKKFVVGKGWIDTEETEEYSQHISRGKFIVGKGWDNQIQEDIPDELEPISPENNLSGPSFTQKAKEGLKQGGANILGGIGKLLEPLSRPGMGVVNALKVSKAFYPKTEFVNVNGKSYPKANPQLNSNDINNDGKVNISDGLQKFKNVASAFNEGFSGRAKPNSLEAFLPKNTVEKFEQSSPFAAKITEIGAGIVTDPLTYIGAGGASKASQLTRVEREMLKAAEANQRALKNLVPTINNASRTAEIVERTPNVDTQVKYTTLRQPKNIKPELEPFNQVKVTTMRTPKKPIEIENTVNKVSTFRDKTPSTQTMPMSERSIVADTPGNVGSRKVNAYQFDNPQVKDNIQSHAVYILDHEFASAKNVMEATTETMIKLKEYTNASYDDIKKGLEAIIKDQGAENIAVAKRVEMAIDDNLTHGFNSIYGDTFPANVDYIAKKKVIEGTKEFTPSTTVQKGLIPQKGSQQIGNPFKSSKTLTPKTVKANQQLPELTQKIVSSNKKESFSFKEALEKFYTRVVDSNSPLKPIGEDTYIKATNSKNVGGTVDYILKEGLVDSSGNKIGKSLKEEVEAIPKGKETSFWEYMLQRHNIDRARENKHVYTNYTPEMSTQAVKNTESANPEFKSIGDSITGWLDTFTREWGVKAGTIEKAMYEDLRETYKSYIPTQRDFSTLEQGIPDGIKRKFADQRTPIKKATGSERDIINPLENIMSLVNRTVRTAKYNEVGQSLADALRKSPDKLKELAEIIPDKDGMFANVYNIVTVLENGKPTYIKVNNKPLLDSLKGLYGKQTGDIEKAAQKFNSIFKSFITQKNPLFAVKNIARDIPTAYTYGSEHNPFKFTKDLFSAGKDLVTNSPNAQRYKAVGGGGSNFFNSGNVAKSEKELRGKINSFKRAGNAIEKFNNLTESAPRLAEFNRVFDKTGDINKALYAANDVSTNFSRGGDLTKTADSFVPYLNAGVQGLDKLARNIKNKPIETAIKGLVGVNALTTFLYLKNKDNPKYQELDNRTKDNYYLFPKEDGTFTKIPKSRELGVLFGSLFERTYRKINGENDAFKGFGETVKTNFSPNNPLENNIVSPIMNLRSNKDFANRPIVPRNMIDDNRSPHLQYDEKTSELAKKIGEITNLSPKQIDYIVRSYTGVIGQLGLPALTKGGNVLKPVTSQFIADPLYSNQEVTNFYDNFDLLKQKAADKNILEKVPSKTVTQEERLRNEFNKASLEITEINKEIRKLDPVKDEPKIRELRQKIINIANIKNKMVK